jgi:hypothetical protein
MTNMTLRALLITTMLMSAATFAQDSVQFGTSGASQPTSHASDARCPLDDDNFRCNPSVAK